MPRREATRRPSAGTSRWSSTAASATTAAPTMGHGHAAMTSSTRSCARRRDAAPRPRHRRRGRQCRRPRNPRDRDRSRPTVPAPSRSISPMAPQTPTHLDIWYNAGCGAQRRNHRAAESRAPWPQHHRPGDAGRARLALRIGLMNLTSSSAAARSSNNRHQEATSMSASACRRISRFDPGIWQIKLTETAGVRRRSGMHGSTTRTQTAIRLSGCRTTPSPRRGDAKHDRRTRARRATRSRSRPIATATANSPTSRPAGRISRRRRCRSASTSRRSPRLAWGWPRREAETTRTTLRPAATRKSSTRSGTSMARTARGGSRRADLREEPER